MKNGLYTDGEEVILVDWSWKGSVGFRNVLPYSKRPPGRAREADLKKRYPYEVIGVRIDPDE